MDTKIVILKGNYFGFAKKLIKKTTKWINYFLYTFGSKNLHNGNLIAI